tara:strand:- start:78 stop:707 length:630 start_codon:yes stop_codon:yes gene_type:complete
MILTGVDTNHEHLIEWWVDNALRHNPNENIGVWDFGMSFDKREKIKIDYPNVWLSTPLDKHNTSGWFYKLHAVIEAPEKRVAWLDVDCEILTSIEDVFDLVPPDMIGLTRDIVRANWWATGVIVVNDRPKLLYDWNYRLNAGNIRGDQEALKEMVGTEPNEQIQELPQDYQWLRISLNSGHDSPTKKVIHWTGPVGRKHIVDVRMKVKQ